MNKEREKIDELIKETLNQEEAKFYDELEEQNLFGKLGGIYKSKLGWLVVIMNIAQVVFVGLLIYCIVQFFQSFDADATHELIYWASAGFVCAIAMSMIKQFVWMQMNKNDILRELKRLELQIAVLSGKIN